MASRRQKASQSHRGHLMVSDKSRWHDVQFLFSGGILGSHQPFRSHHPLHFACFLRNRAVALTWRILQVSFKSDTRKHFGVLLSWNKKGDAVGLEHVGRHVMFQNSAAVIVGVFLLDRFCRATETNRENSGRPYRAGQIYSTKAELESEGMSRIQIKLHLLHKSFQLTTELISTCRCIYFINLIIDGVDLGGSGLDRGPGNGLINPKCTFFQVSFLKILP